MWSYLLTATGALIMYLAGKRRRSAWALGVVNQLAWGSYAYFTHQFGFIFGCVLYGTVYIRNYVSWRKP